ncbi:MAG: hypothetical protein IJX89_01295 [Alphaproteobacteria bacterium]|nr:hypothetical protein [Alphaproteobacteria bacterium]
MKVKNVAFSGFAAAVLAGVCGVADAATVQIASPTYVDNAVKAVADAKQDKLIQGAGITISDDNTISANLGEATVGDTGQTVEEVLNAKQDALTTEETAALETIAGNENLKTVLGSGVSSDTVQQVADNAAAIESLESTKQDTLTAGTNIEINGNTISAKDTTYTAGTGINISADNVITSTVDTSNLATKDELAAKANSADVYTKGEIDTTVSSLVTDSELSTTLESYATTEALNETKTDLEQQIANTVAGDMSEALKAYATTETVNAIDTRVQAAEGEIDALQAATANLDNFVDSTEIAKYSTTEQMNAAIEANKYDDSALAARVTANEGAIAANATDIQTNTDDITAIKDAKYVSSAGQSAGKYLMQVADDGSVTWLDVQIVDAPETSQ